MNRSPDCCCYRYPSHEECPACIAVVREAGRAEERAAIVAWLRPEGVEPTRGGMQVPDMTSPGARRALRDAALAIEHGAHGVAKADEPVAARNPT